MPTSGDFSWTRFDPATTESFARVFSYRGPDDHGERVAFLESRFQAPTLDFVSRAFHSIQSVWLRRNENVAEGVVNAFLKNGVGPRERPTTHIERVRFLSQCSNRRVTRKFFQKAILKYGCKGDWGQDDDFILETAFPRFSVLDPLNQPTDSRAPHDYQRRAWDELSYHLTLAEANGPFEGFLVMPTGSGKTFTSVRWLMENHVNRGGRILWLAHRHELLEQAAQAFASCAALVPNLAELRIRIVSGMHCPASMISSDDHVLCCSVQSLARNREIVDEVLNDDRTFLVVDEAHHASAKSYRDIIERFRNRQDFKLLGLTATPTRTLAHEQPILSQLFGHKRLFEVNVRDLIERGFLSRPIPVIVQTNSRVESGATEEDYQHLQSFNDLSEAWKARIANLTERNEAIARHYIANKDKYGKTLVFALNVAHAELLCERLKEAGVASDYVASYRLDGASFDKREIIQRFRDPSSNLDILVNVMILTEGVDIPNVKTVLLTRPVRSEILLRQMVGRALRGPAAGGTEEAYLVSFEDRWEEFEEWERPLDILQDLIEVSVEAEDDEAVDEPTVPRLAELIPWDLIRQTSREIRRLAKYGDIRSFEAVPAGWYVLEHEDEDDLTQSLIPVYEHQRTCWNAALTHVESNLDEALSDREELRDEFFFDCDTPRPATHHIDGVLTSTIRDGARPEFQPLRGREQCDPTKVAGEIWEDQLGPIEIDRLLATRFEHGLTQAIFGSFEEFRDTIQAELNELTSKKTGRQASLGKVQFEPWGSAQLAPGPHHNLDESIKRVVAAGSEIHELPVLPWSGQINWSRRPITGWYGKAYWHEQAVKGEGEIRINCLLDSGDVSQNAIDFLVWHEYLHLFLQGGHTPVFRRLERKWKGARDAERELSTLSERFEMPFYW